jgi:alanyl-tRNA synthetase
MGSMDFRAIRRKFLEFFNERGHEIVASAPLIPRDDPTLLFTNAGMVQFKSVFLGEEKRGYNRAVTSQKCVRAGGKHNDLENVGYTARHHTFFEMLGNFSFGDYFKQKAVAWAWELLTEGYGLPADKLYASVFHDDDEAYGIWEKEIGLPPERIVRLGEEDNFWAMGDTGPCGPCSEILIDQGEELGCERPDCAPGCDCDRYLEIWNLVFMQFDRDAQGNLTPLPNQNIDTGMGLERIAAVVQGVKSNFDTDLFRDLIGFVEDLSGARYGEAQKRDVSFRVISDHARAAAFLIGDGVMPSNEGRGYVLRRIIRRAIRFGQLLGLEDAFMHRVVGKVIDVMGRDYADLVTSRSFVEGVVTNEEKRFADTLHHGMKVLGENLEELREKGSDTIPGDTAFKLYDTYGLSLDIVQDVAREEGLSVDLEGYDRAMQRQRSQSQQAWKGSGEEEIPEAFRRLTSEGVSCRFLGYEGLEAPARVKGIIRNGESASSASAGEDVEVVLDDTPFYGEAGGQVGDRGWLRSGGTAVRITNTVRFGPGIIVHRGVVEEGTLREGDEITARVDAERRRATARNHTATHLLHKALRETLGDHVKQAGSLVAPDRLRFDFTHFAQVDAEKLRAVEEFVNRRVRENRPLTTREMARDEAVQSGATAIFEERYGETVRVVSVEGVSRELCGGTHTERTGDIGLFKIVSEGAVGANLRRIEALTGEGAVNHIQVQEQEIRALAARLKTGPDQLQDRLERLLKELKEREREVESLKAKLRSGSATDLLEGVREVGGVRLLSREVEADSPKVLREYADQVKERLPSGVAVLGGRGDGKAMLICVVSPDLTGRLKAGEIIKRLSPLVGGKGGGRPDMAQGGGNEPDKLLEALDTVPGLVEELLGNA